MRNKRFKSLKQLSLKEAAVYVSAEEDFNNNFIYYYTVKPSDDPKYHFNNGWETITYYTKRRKPKIRLVDEEFMNDKGYIQMGDGPNTVYIMSNPSIPGLYKIGSTRGSIEDRRKQLSSASGVPTPFKIEWILKMEGNELQLENEVHYLLEHKRNTMNREFFEVSLQEAINTIKKIVSSLDT
tara:strand:- start:41 stop:586 length:546 start_codon:yes stop_codon:yes gene_type:complete